MQKEVLHPKHAMLLTLLLTCYASAAERPNFLIILADDCTHSDLPIYGGEDAVTPNIDRLAKEGLTFNKAYLAEAMCQPCRAELYSGMFPMNNGCAWNHSASFDTVKSMPHYLGDAGYRVGLAGKVHVKPKQAFPFQKVDGFETGCVRNPTRPHDLTAASRFMTDKEQPFCLVIALVDPHVPWVMGDATQYPTKKITLPPNLADNETTRSDFANYLAEITYMDGQVGEILAALDASGQADNTLVLFSSEQGSQFPGCKWTNWDTGVHTALVARWPGKVAANTRTDALVQYADVVPTFMEAAGAALPKDAVDGSSFLGVLKGERQVHRKFVYACHNNVPEGPPYPVRAISDGEFRYIRNLLPDEVYIEKHLMGKDVGGGGRPSYWPSWIYSAGENQETYDLIKRYTRRPAEELYHTSSDPYEMKNLANDTAHESRKQRLSDELDRWLAAQGDPGIAQDTVEAHKAAKSGVHLYGRKPATH